MNASITSHYSYLVVGGGVFGASTAYHLSKSHPGESVAIIDRSECFPCPLAASHDFNKIVRADYGNTFYCQLALEAREVWASDPFYLRFFHQSGMVVLNPDGLGRRIIKNYENLKAHCEAVMVDPDEIKTRYDGVLAGADYRGVKEIFINPLSGWVDATLAVNAVIETAVSLGVKYIQADISSLVFNEDGDCTGVRTTDGRNISAGKIILSTGAGTAKLLGDSAPTRPELQVEDRIAAAAVITGVVKLNEFQMNRFKKAPVFIHEFDTVLGQVLPPNADGLLKFCVDVSFKNTSYHQKSGQMISAPPDLPDQKQHDAPKSLQDECSRVVNGIYGKELEGFKFDSFRICWDGITPNQDFIISTHPHCKNLYIATAGSFHGWKFLPIIGKYVVKLLDGELDEDLVKRWAWDREQKGSAHERVVPRRELRDLL